MGDSAALAAFEMVLSYGGVARSKSYQPAGLATALKPPRFPNFSQLCLLLWQVSTDSIPAPARANPERAGARAGCSPVDFEGGAVRGREVSPS